MTKNNSLKTNSPKKYILIDTCVIQDAESSTRQKSEEVIEYLEGLAREGFSLAISEFTIYENLQGLWGKQATEAVKVLQSYEQKSVSQAVLVLASMLQGLYHDERVDNVPDGDKLIAATCILENGYVLTRDHRDFPHPYFITERSIAITYKKGRVNTTLDLALYKPNMSVITRRINAKDNG